MRFAVYISSFTITAVSAIVSTQCLPFSFKHVFSAQITIVPALSPITIPGGTLVIEPITGGTVNGSAVNGTILSGFAYPTLYDNRTVDVPSIGLYGKTSDNQTFHVSEMGIGTVTAQVTRIKISINGTKYEEVNNGFILASVVPTNSTSIAVEAYLVANTQVSLTSNSFESRLTLWT